MIGKGGVYNSSSSSNSDVTNYELPFGVIGRSGANHISTSGDKGNCELPFCMTDRGGVMGTSP